MERRTIAIAQRIQWLGEVFGPLKFVGEELAFEQVVFLNRMPRFERVTKILGGFHDALIAARIDSEIRYYMVNFISETGWTNRFLL